MKRAQVADDTGALVFRMDFRGHFKNSRFHSFQNSDFKMCVCLIDVERL